MPKPRHLLALLVAACLLVLTACTGSSGGESAPSTPATGGGTQQRDVGRPVVGECRTYDAVAAEAAVELSGPVPCEDAHTAETIAVVDALPAPSADGRWTDEQVAAAARAECGPAVHAEAVGLGAAELATTRLSQTFFTPPQKQAIVGARWIRCDSVVFVGGDPSLVVGRHRELVKAPGAFAMCAAKLPADPFTAVRCPKAEDATAGSPRADKANAELYAAVGAVPLAQYAGARTAAAVAAARTAVTERCRVIVAEASDTRDARWRTSFPAQGLVGQDSARCWVRLADWKLRDGAGWPDEEALGASVTA